MESKVTAMKQRHLKDLRALICFEKKATATLRYLAPSDKGILPLKSISDASISIIWEGGVRGTFMIVRRLGDI